jgi:hypothetical protein
MERERVMNMLRLNIKKQKSTFKHPPFGAAQEMNAQL